jgi:outer membrane protein assembly factor BamB
VRVDARLDRPVVLDGTVVTTATADRSLAGTTNGESPVRVLAFDVETGERQWAFELDAVRRARITATVGDRVYVVGERVENGDGDRLYAVDTDGTIAWRFGAERLTAIAATDSVVFASVRHGSVVAIDAEKGRPAARLHPTKWPGGRWLSDLTPAGRPAVLDGTVVAPFARYDADREDSYYEDRIVAFDGDGIAWTAALDDVCFIEHVTASDGTVYVLTMDRCPGGVEPPIGSLRAFDATSGERRWTRSVESGLTSPLAAREGTITTTGGDVRTFGSDGTLRWRAAVFSGPPVIAGDRVYGRRTEGSFVDTVVAADIETGEPVASHTFQYQLNRAPVFADGRAIARTLEYDRTDEGAEHVADRLHVLQ